MRVRTCMHGAGSSACMHKVCEVAMGVQLCAGRLEEHCYHGKMQRRRHISTHARQVLATASRHASADT